MTNSRNPRSPSLNRPEICGLRSECGRETALDHWDHRIAGSILLTSFCGLQGLATVAIDLNRTHASNPLWPGHARFHVVWQIASVVQLSVLEICLIWWRGPFARQRFDLAACLASVSCFGFLLACAGMRFYGGSLSDPNGIPPVRIAIAGRDLCLDLNLAAILMALLLLVVILAISQL
jgi:hypothetical protein